MESACEHDSHGVLIFSSIYNRLPKLWLWGAISNKRDNCESCQSLCQPLKGLSQRSLPWSLLSIVYERFFERVKVLILWGSWWPGWQKRSVRYLNRVHHIWKPSIFSGQSVEAFMLRLISYWNDFSPNFRNENFVQKFFIFVFLSIFCRYSVLYQQSSGWYHNSQPPCVSVGHAADEGDVQCCFFQRGK